MASPGAVELPLKIDPQVRVGWASKLGAASAALLAAAAAFAPLLEGVGAGTSRHLATLATVLAGLTVLGRMGQAIAGILLGKSVAEGAVFPAAEGDEFDVLGDDNVPDDAALRRQFPDEPGHPDLKTAQEGRGMPLGMTKPEDA